MLAVHASLPILDYNGLSLFGMLQEKRRDAEAVGKGLDRERNGIAFDLFFISKRSWVILMILHQRYEA
jgi:hypothetical protein